MKKSLTLAAICMMALLISIEITAMNLIIAPITNVWHISIANAQWIMSVYMLVFGVLCLISGHFADKFNLRVVLMLGILIFIIGSWVGGAAHSFDILLIGRALQGIGAAFCYPNLFPFVNEVFPEKKATGYGVLLSGTSFGATFGPLLGGLLAHHFGWRSVLYFNIPLSILALIPLLFSGIRVAASKVQHSSQSHDSLIHKCRELMLIKTYRQGCVLRIVVSASYMAFMYLLALYLQKSLHLSVLAASFVFLPLTFVSGIFSMIAGRMIDRHGEDRLGRWSLIGFSIGFIGIAVMAASHLVITIMIVLLVLMGLSYAFLYPASVHLALKNVTPTHKGAASGIFTTLNILAKVVGVFICGLVLHWCHASAQGDAITVAHATAWVLGIMTVSMLLILRFAFSK